MRPIFLPICIFISLFTHAQVHADILIKNGRILDGTGNSWYYGDVAVKDGKILKIGQLGNYTAAKVIDAKQKIISPGFIDVHTHIEGDEFRNPTADNFILDGVTTVVTGNCGSSHTDINRYFWRLDSLKTSVNVATLLGHNDVRRAVMGMSDRDPSEEELKKMEAIVEQAMLDGAVGLSTGLIYTPGTYSKTSEILRLAQVASRYKGIYASHMRSESDSIVPAINEALYIGRTAGMPVQISHFKISGQQNWGRSSETVPMIVRAREEGIDVTIDQYPYTASSTSLNIMMPDDILAGGFDSMKARLQDPHTRKNVSKGLQMGLKKRKLKHFSYAVVAFHRADTS